MRERLNAFRRELWGEGTNENVINISKERAGFHSPDYLVFTRGIAFKTGVGFLGDIVTHRHQ